MSPYLLALLLVSAPLDAGLDLSPLPHQAGVLMNNVRISKMPAAPSKSMVKPTVPGPASALPDAPGSGHPMDVLSQLRHVEQVIPGTRVVFKYKPSSRKWALVEGRGGLCPEAWQAVALAPAWIRQDLAGNLSELTPERQAVLVDPLLNAPDPRYRDELAFLLAAIGPEDLARDKLLPTWLLDQVERLYAVEPLLDYVSLKEVGDPESDDDYYTTTVYTSMEGGEEIQWELPREYYYWYVVHPKLDGEELYDIYPGTGQYAPPNNGRNYRWYFLDPPEGPDSYTWHYLFRAQATHGMEAVDVEALSGWGPSQRGWITSENVGPLDITLDSDGNPTTIEYRLAKGTVLVTTLEVERAAAQGKSNLLENMLRYGPGNVVQTKFGKHLVVKDRPPFGAEDIIEGILDAHYVVYEVITSDELAEYDLEGVQKIIVPSDQPLALYQAMADRKEELDAWLKDGWKVLEVHGAVTDPADDWSGLLMPGDFTVTDVAGEGSDTVVIQGQPRLDELFPISHVWDGETHPSLSGERYLDPDTFAFDKIGWWVSQNMFDNVSEWGEKHGLQPERSIQAVRIVWNHFGNCGELQDMLTSSSRTLLLPVTNVSNSNEDHVWNEFYFKDEWHPLQVSWSDSSTHVNSPSVSADNFTGGGKNISMVSSSRGDGHVYDVSGHYSETVTINIHLVDGEEQPMEGVEVLLASEAYYEQGGSYPLIIGLWGLTDETGTWTVRVGEANNYYVRALSRLGTAPPEDNKVTKILGEAQAVADTEHDITLQIAGVPEPRGPAAVAADIEPDEEIFLSIKSKPLQAQRCGVSVYSGTTFCDFAGEGNLAVAVLDEDNYQAFKAGETFNAISWAPLSAGLDLSSPAPADQAWYLVLINQNNHQNRSYLELDLQVLTEAEPPPESAEPAPADVTGGESDVAQPSEDAGSSDVAADPAPESSGGDSGGCSSSGPARTPWLLLLVLFALAGLRRKESGAQ